MEKAKLQKKALKWSAIIAKKLDLILLRRKNFCIISNNCWGNTLYEILKREYNTPFVGLFLIPSHYIKFIYNIENNIRINLTEDHFKKSDKITHWQQSMGVTFTFFITNQNMKPLANGIGEE